MKKARILLADDDPIMRELASAKLTEAGWDPSVAKDGREARVMLESDRFDLLITDLEMPHMDGFELTQKIRSSDHHNELPIIVITGTGHSDAVERAFSAGATSFLTKPMNWTLFSQSVRFVLRASEDQKALRVALEAADAGARFKESLLSMMSHELRTPLNAIIGFSQILNDLFEQQDDHLHKEYAGYIVDGGKRLLNSISDILLASDASAGPLSLDEAECELEELLEAAQSELSKTIAASSVTVNVIVDNKDHELQCDRRLIVRALAKLLENAVKFSGQEAKIFIGATVLRNGDLALFVKDNGPGLSSEALEQALQPFSQLDMSLKRSNEGLGLGLPIVKAIAENHGGDLKIISSPGKGAQAMIVLPKARLLAAASDGGVQMTA